MSTVLLPKKSSHSKGKENEADRIERLLRWKPSFELKIRFPYFLSGHDKTGCPVWVVRFGIWDVRSVVEEGGQMKKDFDDYVEQFLVLLTQSPKRKSLAGKTVQHFMIVVDMSNYNNNQITHFKTLQTVLNITKRAKVVLRKEDNLKKAIIVNSNNFFLTMWKLASPILGDLTKLFELHGTNGQKWQQVLSDNIDKDQLPTFLGGSINEEVCRRSSITSH